MPENSENNKRIAKNTLFLYFRMLLTMGVTFYTSRVVLNTLGVEDYGIMNVVGGVIAMFTFINNSMSSATQRYIIFALGKGDLNQLKKVFSASLQIHALIAFGIVILGETIGLWFVCNKLVIPESRMTAAFWVYQCSIITTVINILSVSYNADIIAHEKMSAFAYISIVDSLLKLAIVYALLVSPWDKLVVYAILLMIVQIMVRYVYAIYCHRHFEESYYHHHFDKDLLKEMGSFAGWSFWGNLAAMLFTQGVNILLNIFFGPIVNAARGIAIQVQSAMQQFVGSFQIALNPQITKTYAQDNLPQMHLLMFRSARFSFLLLYLLALPVLLETNWVLTIWLKQVPENTVLFTQLIICVTLIYTIANPCVIANQATGQVKVYQMVVGGILLAIFPISYIVLKMGAPAYSVFIVHFVMESVAQLSRMYMLRKLIKLPMVSYITNIYIPLFLVVVVSFALPWYVHMQFDECLLRFVVVGFSSVVSVGLFAYLLGLTKNERTFINGKILKLLHIV